jgi:hypothetical protein
LRQANAAGLTQEDIAALVAEALRPVAQFKKEGAA